MNNLLSINKLAYDRETKNNSHQPPYASIEDQDSDSMVYNFKVNQITKR